MKLNETEKQELAIKYEPLVHKIANQFYNKLSSSNEDILGWAHLGLVEAMNKYKKGSSQSFKQFAGYIIRFTILNGNNQTGHIVKFSTYHQNKVKQANGSTNIWERLNMSFNDEGDEYINYNRMPGLVLDPNYDTEIDTEIIMSNIYRTIEREFSKRDCDMFYKFNGLHDEEQMKCKDIAKQYRVSATLVSLTNKRIMEFIKDKISVQYCSNL